MKTLSQISIDSGGDLVPLMLDTPNSSFNPTILFHKNQLYAIVRSCQYTLLHAEKQRFPHKFGPLVYLNPENDVSLTTKNYLLHLNDDLSISRCVSIDTSAHDSKPRWTFVGLEDARLVSWGDKLYACGVRRDTKSNGEGRMELSEIDVNSGREISRVRMPAPSPNTSYCEKNWMPVLDKPYTFVKWNNPVEVVAFDGKQTSTVKLDKQMRFSHDLRGGSQVVPFEDGYLCIVHETHLFRSETNAKNGRYLHRFVKYDKELNIVSYSDAFSILGADIEFAAGLVCIGDNILISFGFQDNAAYILSTPSSAIKSLLCNH